MSVHGSPESVRALVDHCIKNGARMAEPGEFTLRTFMNGKIDLTQAEGVCDTVNALTSSQLKQANRVRQGELQLKVARTREQILQVLAAVEAATDFSEEVGVLDREAQAEQVRQARNEVEALLSTARAAAIVRHGLRIALVGLPNAGKSSLLNALLQHERAIVTEIPGTTRDTLEEMADLGGFPCVLIDTAGLRNSDDRVEKIGIERAKQAAEQADLVWYLYAADQGWTDADQEFFASVPSPVVIATKCDLAHPEHGLATSAMTGEGLDTLVHLVQQRSGLSDGDGGLINQRHEGALTKAQEALADVEATLVADVPDDLAAVGLRQASRALGEITGESAGADIVEEIFSRFCIGK
jgi:tRNA modification GTPase